MKHKELHSLKTILELKRALAGFIIQCEDHAPTKLCVFCPKLYLQLHQKTMSVPSVFKVHNTSISTVQQTIIGQFPKQLRKQYKWGINPDLPLPSCYIFPKRKKLFQKARPVITFYNTQFAILYKALGKLINDLTSKVYPDAFHGKSTLNTFRHLHKFLKKNQTNLHSLIWKSDDIKGFFTSVEHSTINTAFHHLVQTYAAMNTHTQASEIKLSINFTLPAKRARTVQGKTFQTKSVKTIWLKDSSRWLNFH